MSLGLIIISLFFDYPEGLSPKHVGNGQTRSRMNQLAKVRSKESVPPYKRSNKQHRGLPVKPRSFLQSKLPLTSILLKPASIRA